MHLNLLIADHDPAVFSLARAALLRRDCSTEAAFSGFDCLARARAGGIDAVLLDLDMPNTDGFSVLAELTRLPSAPAVLLMTCATDPRIEQSVAKGQALAALPKPVDFDLALRLLSRRSNAECVHLHLPLDRPSFLPIAAQALARGTLFLENAPILQSDTPLEIALETPMGRLTLTGASDSTVRFPGRHGLGVRLDDLGAVDQERLRALSNATPEPISAVPRPAADTSAGDDYFRRGFDKLETGKYDSALIDLRHALELEPDNALFRATCQRAEAHAGMHKAAVLFRRAEEQSDPAEALKLIDDAIRLDSSRATYHCEAARLTLRIGGALDKAEAHIAEAIHLAPSDPAPRHLFAQMLERAGRYQEALWACDAALQLFPGDKDLAKLLTRLRRKCGNS